MTVKSVVDSASIRVYSNAPSAVFASSDTIALEMRDLVNEVAHDIAQSFDWRDITKIARFTGDGVQDFFAKPDDYDRMLMAQGIRDQKNWFWGYFQFDNINEWLMMKENGFSLLSPGGWIIFDGGFNFVPAPNGTAQFPYISKLIVRDVDGELKQDFSHDDDTFVLSERLLTLGLIWRYKAQKGFEHSEDLANYEKDFAQLTTRDRGSRVYRHGAPNNYPGSRIAYPWTLG